MGVDSADFNQDGWMDLFVTNLDHELCSMYQNKHDKTFEDKAVSTGIAAATELMSGGGVKFFDYDNDGNLDLLIANGHWDFPDRGAQLTHLNCGAYHFCLAKHNRTG